ncbi:transglycosylase protein with SLT domain [Kineococcus rhizosphaerae]|uniref:Transglycosylase protein with SLT domain n=1 Tax=Kineococcus rhizosphaerae TaxID=559628 RepID=A0A2T0RA57_9ACTN|nr:transglycosylase protein with SLT domain [Kineococcus rhizosphaerae]
MRLLVPACVAALVIGSTAGTASAAPGPSSGAPTTAAAARAQALAAQAAAEEAGAQVQAVQAQLVRSQAAVASAVSASVRAQVGADAADRAASRERALATQRVRSIYMGAGTSQARRGLALLTSAVGGGDPVVTVRAYEVVRRQDEAGVARAEAAARAGRVAASTEGAGAVAAVATVRDVGQQLTRMQDALAAAQAKVQALQGEAARLQAAEDAAEALAAAQAAAAAAQAAAAASVAQRAAGVRAGAVPADYADLYVRAAATCAGMRPALLAAVGQVESGHGVDAGTSSAGAQGPMQFLPSTFAAYGVDGDGDGAVRIDDAADAVFSAARYLCANGAGGGRDAEAAAVFRYNHADWYVQMVQRVADELAARGFGG